MTVTLDDLPACAEHPHTGRRVCCGTHQCKTTITKIGKTIVRFFCLMFCDDLKLVYFHYCFLINLNQEITRDMIFFFSDSLYITNTNERQHYCATQFEVDPLNCVELIYIHFLHLCSIGLITVL